MAVIQELIGILLIFRGCWLCWTGFGYGTVDDGDLKYYLAMKVKTYMAAGLVFLLMGILDGQVRMAVVSGAEAAAAILCVLLNLAAERAYVKKTKEEQRGQTAAGWRKLAAK